MINKKLYTYPKSITTPLAKERDSAKSISEKGLLLQPMNLDLHHTINRFSIYVKELYC